MKLPGPDHPITIEPVKGRVVVRFAGEVVPDKVVALLLCDASYKPVFYIPRGDGWLDHFVRSGHRTHCSYKGDASYFALVSGSAKSANAVWRYEKPFPAMAAIREHLAFYPQQVTIEHAA